MGGNAGMEIAQYITSPNHSRDGSHKSRKICEIIGETRSEDRIFANAAGTKIGYVSFIDNKGFLFIHDTDSGKLLHKI
jgi:hypothetical protein